MLAMTEAMEADAMHFIWPLLELEWPQSTFHVGFGPSVQIRTPLRTLWIRTRTKRGRRLHALLPSTAIRRGAMRAAVRSRASAVERSESAVAEMRQPVDAGSTLTTLLR